MVMGNCEVEGLSLYCSAFTSPFAALQVRLFPHFWSSLLDQLCTQGPAGAQQRFPLITSFIKYFVFHYWNRVTLILGNGCQCYTETGAQTLNTFKWRRNEELNHFVRELKMWLVELALPIVYYLGQKRLYLGNTILCPATENSGAIKKTDGLISSRWRSSVMNWH